MNEDDLFEKLKNYKKINITEIEGERCELKDYMRQLNLTRARMRFKLRTKMTPAVQMNFRSEKKFANNDWKCVGCTDGWKDTQTHIIHCDGYADLRYGKTWKKTKIWQISSLQ